MCRFYGRGLDRYYRLCCRKKNRQGEHVFWAEGRADIRRRMSGNRCVPLRQLPRAKQKSLFSDYKKSLSQGKCTAGNA